MDKILKENYDVFQTFINCIKVGIFITDAQGKVIMLNDEFESTRGISKSELVGRHIEDLADTGYGTVSRTPFFQNGKLDMIICTQRETTDGTNLKEGSDGGNHIIARSEEMKRVVEMAMRIAILDTTVFLKGESGTGKELIATLLHENSSRKNEAFIKVNCAAIPKNLMESELFGYEKGAFTGADTNGKAGIFELADKGTLFLDEISELPIQMQSKLLRVLQEREIVRIGGKNVIPVNVRIIVASNVDMLNALKEGRFREDLYYRLNIIPIEMPPLRERKADIAPLTAHFVKHFNIEYDLNKTLKEDAVTILEEQQWLGNVRELRNMIERVVIGFDGNDITAAQIASQLGKSSAEQLCGKQEETIEDLDRMIEKYEKNLLEKLMTQYGSGSEVARLLNVNKSTISRKLKKHKITIIKGGEI